MIENILAKLQGVKQTGDKQYDARCPAHDDGRASLSVSVGDDGRVLIHCHAGCATDAVVKSIGATMADLQPKPVGSSRREVAIYNYRDESGALLYQVMRFEPKDFRQRKPKAGGGSVWNMQGVRRVPYRLPELLAAPAGEAIFIVEGEKDADNLAGRGFVATCNVGGAGKWRAEYGEHFRGRRVVIIPDKDEPGRRHADQVAAALVGIAAEVKVLELPGDCKDVSDWLVAGGTADELRTLAEAAPVADVPDILAIVADDEPTKPQAADPGEIPEKLRHVPGFVNLAREYILSISPYPNPLLAFAAALALQAFLASRKITDGAGSRSNLYIVSVASSGTGKDHPRRGIRKILQSCGLDDCIGDSIASYEGLENMLFVKPQLLLLSDEFQHLLEAMKSGRELRWVQVANTLLKLYTSAADIYNMRIKVDQPATSINQPGLTLAASAVPSRMYEAMSRDVLTNGLFARLIIIPGSKRGRFVRPQELEPPAAITDIAKFWANFHPGAPANLATMNPQPRVVDCTPQAESVLADFQHWADDRYSEAETDCDDVAMSVWARAGEKARRLGLIYAASLDHVDPRLPEAGAQWAADFVTHLTRQMLAMAAEHVEESPFHGSTLEMSKAVKAWNDRHGKGMPAWKLRRKMQRLDEREYDNALKALAGQALIRSETIETGGRPATVYFATSA